MKVPTGLLSLAISWHCADAGQELFFHPLSQWQDQDVEAAANKDAVLDTLHARARQRYLGGEDKDPTPSPEEQENVVCPLCANGEPFTKPPDTFLYMDEACRGGMTVDCAALEERANALTQEDVDEGNCAGYQELGYSLCGCESRPGDDLQCSLCPDGSAVPAEHLEGVTEGCSCKDCPDLYGIYGTCRELLLFAAQESRPEQCLNLHRFGLGDCGCPPPDGSTCELCPSGEFDPSIQLTSTTTCEGAAAVAAGETRLPCAAFQKVANYCNCPDDPPPGGVCRLCGGDQPLPDTRWGVFPDLTAIGLGKSPTSCLFLEVLANAVPPAACPLFQAEAAEHCCGPLPSCPLCAEGEDPTVDLDAELPFPFVDGTPATCRKLENLVVGFFPDESSSFPTRGEITCASWHEVTAQYCGCSTRDEVPCTLCPDRSLPEDPDRTALFTHDEEVDEYAIHCSDLLRLAGEEQDGESSECMNFQHAGIQHCRCPVPEEYEGNCPLCMGGNEKIPDPDREIMPYTDCDGLSRMAALTDNDQECAAFQKVAGLYCGCPDFKRGKKGDIVDKPKTCRICGEGRPLVHTGNMVAFENETLSCAELEWTSNVYFDETECMEYQKVGAAPCCGGQKVGKKAKKEKEGEPNSKKPKEEEKKTKSFDKKDHDKNLREKLERTG